MLIAFILAASLPFVLRKPAVVDQSTPFVIEHKHITIRMQDELVDKETAKTSGTITWNQDGAGVDHAVVYLFRTVKLRNWWKPAVLIPTHKVSLRC